MDKRYDKGGQRVTSCCGSYSTYMDDGYNGLTMLCCKKCYNEVDFGEGDGSEFRDGVDVDEYYRIEHERDKQRVAKLVAHG